MSKAIEALKLFFHYYKPDVLPAGEKELRWNDFVQAADDALIESGSETHRYDKIDHEAEVIFFGRDKI